MIKKKKKIQERGKERRDEAGRMKECEEIKERLEVEEMKDTEGKETIREK